MAGIRDDSGYLPVTVFHTENRGDFSSLIDEESFLFSYYTVETNQKSVYNKLVISYIILNLSFRGN